MIELLQQYGLAFLWNDGYNLSGLAMTLWLLVASIGLGFVLALPLAIGHLSPASPRRPVDLTVLYVGAEDCTPCGVWESGDGVRFRSSAYFARVSYREVKARSTFDVLSDEYWPESLRRHRAAIGERSAVPLWLVIADGEVVAQKVGPYTEAELEEVLRRTAAKRA